MALKNSPLTEDIDIIPFQKEFQEEVVELFRDGLSPKTYNIGPTVARSQKLFVASKLSKENGGDMYNIWDSYMEKDPTSNSNCHLNHFWVAFDKTKQIVVGHVGVILSTYSAENSFIYHSPELNPFNVCELVRMGVHPEYRGRRIGKRLCETLEKYAYENGMKQIVLSTLEEMQLATKMYEKYGFRLADKAKIPLEDFLGPGDWEELIGVHYVKEVKDNF